MGKEIAVQLHIPCAGGVAVQPHVHGDFAHICSEGIVAVLRAGGNLNPSTTSNRNQRGRIVCAVYGDAVAVYAHIRVAGYGDTGTGGTCQYTRIVIARDDVLVVQRDAPFPCVRTGDPQIAVDFDTGTRVVTHGWFTKVIPVLDCDAVSAKTS